MVGVCGIAGRQGSPTIENLPVLDAPTLLHWIGGRRLVSALRSKLGFPVEFFDRDLRPMIHGYAAFVQLLPATECGHHAEPGGLLKHGLETVGFTLDAGRSRTHSLDVSPEAFGGQGWRRCT
jgi:hypothetical protein